MTELSSKLVWLALAYRYVGKMDKAWRAANKVKQLEPNGILWAYAFAFLQGAEGKGKYWIASFYAMAGDKEEAFRWMTRAIELGNRNYRWFAVDPNLESLREDPRFVEILKKAETAAKKLGKYLHQRDTV